ncbi:MAG: hypothetical protein R3281_07220 [Balneolaceae bacterium]|nr:hypothetical protein [Balneolaceae bacterium]
MFFSFASHIIERGFAGGQIVGTGTPEEMTEIEKSYTGTYLKDVLNL